MKIIKAAFKRRLRGTSWDLVKSVDNPNKSYIKFIEKLHKFMMTLFQKLNLK